jgi:hypothetical protein
VGRRNSHSRLIADHLLPKPDACSSSIFLNEFDPGGFESSPDYIQSGSARTACFILQLMNSHGTNSSLFGEVLLAPRN